MSDPSKSSRAPKIKNLSLADLSRMQKEDEEVWKELEPVIRQERKKLYRKHYET